VLASERTNASMPIALFYRFHRFFCLLYFHKKSKFCHQNLDLKLYENSKMGWKRIFDLNFTLKFIFTTCPKYGMVTDAKHLKIKLYLL
jgi:hypothetical protein